MCAYSLNLIPFLPHGNIFFIACFVVEAFMNYSLKRRGQTVPLYLVPTSLGDISR